MPLHVQIITPEKIVLDANVDEATLPTINGEISILPKHMPLLTQLAPGELILKTKSSLEHFVVVGGFLEVNSDKVSILADYAVHGKDISAVKAQEAKDRAEKAMKEKTSEEDFVLAEAEFRRAILELKVAKKYRKNQ